MAVDVVVALSDLIERTALLRLLEDHTDVEAHVADGLDAIWQLCKERAPDVVLVGTDFDSEDGGRTICRKLKSRPSTRHISVILVCGRHETLVATDGTDGLPDEVVLRPLHVEEALLRLRSIVRLRRYSAELMEASRLDPLTSVFTRAHLLERLRHELARAERYGRSLALLLVDLDAFASINTSLGATRGDQVLREVARALISRVRGVDLVARAGDDEFAVVLPETSLLVARPVAERLRAAVNSVLIEGKPVRCSIGIAGVPHPAIEDLPSFLRCAREALARARTEGNRSALY